MTFACSFIFWAGGARNSASSDAGHQRDAGKCVNCRSRGEVYDSDGWKVPPGPPPGGLWNVGGAVGQSHHCGNQVTFTVVGADGGAESVTYEDRPCAETPRAR